VRPSRRFSLDPITERLVKAFGSGGGTWPLPGRSGTLFGSGMVMQRQREPTLVMAAGKFHQRLDRRFDQRMGRKQVGKTLARTVDAEAELALARKTPEGTATSNRLAKGGVKQQQRDGYPLGLPQGATGSMRGHALR
jgi:hypothetical protein